MLPAFGQMVRVFGQAFISQVSLGHRTSIHYLLEEIMANLEWEDLIEIERLIC